MSGGMDQDIEWLEVEEENEPEKWFEGSSKAQNWLTSNHQEEEKEIQWLESTGKADEDKDEEVEWLGSTKKASSSDDGWFLSSKEVEEGESHMGRQWFEASVEDLGQLEIFDLPPALNVHVEVTAGELLAAYYKLGDFVALTTS